MTYTKEMVLYALDHKLFTADIIPIWNEYAESISDDCGYIYANEESELEGYFDSVSEAIRAVCYGDYRYTDNYFRFNGYGNLESFDYATSENSPIDFDSLADFILEDIDSYEEQVFGDFTVTELLCIGGTDEEEDDSEE